MIALRLLAAAMLFNKQGDLLMMKRSPSRTLSPGMWGGSRRACRAWGNPKSKGSLSAGNSRRNRY
ncbi:hypothetical protein [Paenibacillus larvae]|uniref:hypothetical protein n=1 Tax=Paenibacillus larvae TaxID=1464 RepID=UPI0002481786|nr:hypothetical protein [Paenibacillus larvae]